MIPHHVVTSYYDYYEKVTSGRRYFWTGNRRIENNRLGEQKEKRERKRKQLELCARSFERQEKNVSETNCKGLSLPLFPFLRILNPSITQRITFCVWKARVSIRLHWGKSGPCLSVWLARERRRKTVSSSSSSAFLIFHVCKRLRTIFLSPNGPAGM